MRKLLKRVVLLLFVLFPLISFAQTSITGKVISEKDGSPIEGASVIVKGKGGGTKTDASGNFTINANKGDVLIITSVSFKGQQFRIKSDNAIAISLEKTESTLDEVIVTAMDIKKKPREVGFAAQSVKGSDIQESQRDNLINGLDGRVAGLTVNSTSGMAGASSSIVLRGFNSLALDNQPLFVVDGVVMDNSTVNETSGGGIGLGLVENSTRNVNQTSNRSTDYTNRIADINPNDIENVTVLKGPEATALYGSQASSGAIIITTRRGRKDGKIGITYDNSFRVSALTRYPEVSDLWASGTNGIAGNLFSYFGPAQNPALPKYDNLQNFFKTGFSQTHNLSIDAGNEKSSVRASASFLDQSGIVPNNNFRKAAFKVAYRTTIKDIITISPSLTFSYSTNDKPKRGAGGYMLNLLIWPRTNDASNYLSADGKKLTLYTADPNGELDNPFFNVEFNKGQDVTLRKTASTNVTIKPNNWLTLTGIFGLDVYSTNGWSFYHPLSSILTKGTGGSLDNYYVDYKGYNHTITASATKSIKKFSGRVMVGTMWQDYKRTMYSVYGTNLVDSVTNAGLMSKNNAIVSQDELRSWLGDSSTTRASSRLRLSRGLRYGDANYSVSRQLAFFGEFSFNYDKKIYLTYSHRFENSSIFPKDYRAYNYPAGSLSFIMSDLLPFIKKGNILNFWKLRGSLASTARSPLPYSNQSVFGNVTSSGGGYAYGLNNNNIYMEPEIQKTYEIGTEFKFLKNKIGIDVSYYNTLNEKQIAENFRASYGTGYVLNTLNVGSTRNQGVEITLDLTPISSKKLTWTSQFNFNHMWNKVLSLPANVPEFYISDSWVYLNARGGLVTGGPTTSITSYGYSRNDKGDILINPTTGLPISDGVFKVHGDRNPDFTIGWSNKLRFKNFTISFLLDSKFGGDIFNATDMYLTIAGLSKRTDDRYTPRVIKGVLNDGLQNSANPTVNTIAVTPAYNQNYYASTGMPEEEFIEKDVNWVRLRELTFRYNFPAKIYKRLRSVTGLSAFVTGNDLFMLTNYTGGDPAVNANTAGTRGVGAWGFDYGNTPTPISVNVGFKVAF